jgi:branched-chain amino acid transport system substrate-binding protein
MRILRLNPTYCICRFIATAFLFAAVLGFPLNNGYCTETIKVGIILPLTGEKASSGQMEKQAFVLALEDINAKRNQAGEKTIEVLIEDNASKPEGARLATDRLIRQGEIALLIGGVSSNTVWAIAPITNKKGIPLLITSAPADKITEQGWEYVFRLCPPASERYISLFSFLDAAVSPRTIAIFHENSLSGLKGTQSMLTAFKAKGYEIIANKGYKRGTEDFTPLLGEIKQKPPDAIYLVSSPKDASLLIRQVEGLGLNPKIFIGSADGFASPDFYANAGLVAGNLITTARWSPSVTFEGTKAFTNKFEARYKKIPDHHGAEAYAAAFVIDDALRRASSTEPKAVRQALAETNLMTVVGPVKFTSLGKKTNQNRAPTYIVQWIDGLLEIVWPEQYTTAKYRLAR